MAHTLNHSRHSTGQHVTKRGPPLRAFIVTGPPGAGKSTVAGQIAECASQISLIRNDILRPELGYPLLDSSYTPLLYREMALRAAESLRNDISVVLDATFYLRKYRTIVFSELSRFNVDWVHVQMTTSIDKCRQRVAKRIMHGKATELGVYSVDRFESVVARSEPIESHEWPGTRAVTFKVDGGGRRPRMIDHGGAAIPEVTALLEEVCA